jgi:hypothetical protein
VTAFEMILVDAGDALPRVGDPTAFMEHMQHKEATKDSGPRRVIIVCAFPSLGRDCTLVVPCELGGGGARSFYGHLGAFVRGAPKHHQQELWAKVGLALRQRLRARPSQPVWVSTAGNGIPWLHVRLDDPPKYIKNGPYRSRYDWGAQKYESGVTDFTSA